MLNLNNKIRESLSKKKLNNASVGIFCTKILENFIWKNIKIKWYAKNNILFVKTEPSFAKNEIYLQKNKALKKINEKLKLFWYKIRIKDIIIK